jgi:hypothetical protein
MGTCRVNLLYCQNAAATGILVDRKLGNIDGGVTRTPAVSESAIGEKKFWCGSCGESRSEQGVCVLFRSADLPCAFWQEGRSSVKVRLIRKVAANLRQPKCGLRQESARSCEMSPLPDLSLLPRPILYGRAVERSDGRFQAPVSWQPRANQTTRDRCQKSVPLRTMRSGLQGDRRQRIAGISRHQQRCDW